MNVDIEGKCGEADKKLGQYYWGGLAMLVMGVVFCVFNAALDVAEYQKVGPFNSMFFVVGGALGLSAGFPRGLKYPLAEKVDSLGWKAAVVLVLLSFGLTVREILSVEYADSTSLMLVVGLMVYYFITLYLVKLRNNPEKAAKSMETAEVLIVAIALAVIIKGVGVQAFKIPSGSMLHTLQVGDHLLISKFTYGVPLPYTDARVPGFRDPERGDVIVFAYPGMDNSDRPPFQKPGAPDILKEQDFIKRIIGMPGETVELRGNSLFVNGQPVEDPWGQYLNSRGEPLPDIYKSRGQLADYGPATIPPDMYLVMGDNRFHSNDGRVWGFVKKGRIKGNAMVIYWSWAGLKRIGTIIR